MEILPNKIHPERLELGDKIHLLASTEAPLYILVNRLSKKTCLHPDFTWLSSGQPINNSLQIFRNAIQSTAIEGGPDHSYIRKKRTIEVTMDMEKAFLHGRLHSSFPRITGGLDFFCYNHSTLRDDRNLTRQEIFQAWLPGFARGSVIKYLFGSSQHITDIVNAFSGMVNIFPPSFGPHISQIPTHLGSVNLVCDRFCLDKMYLLSLEQIVYRFLLSRDIAIERIKPEPIWEQVLCEAGLEFGVLDNHLVIARV